MTKTLFVEDEPRGVNPYFTGLKRRSIECELAQNFDEALYKLERGRYDLVSLDLNFARGKNRLAQFDPLSAGLKLLELIRGGKIKNCPDDVVVIVLTASSSRSVEKQIKSLGVFEYLTKPVDYRSVMATFERAQGHLLAQKSSGQNNE